MIIPDSLPLILVIVIAIFVFICLFRKSDYSWKGKIAISLGAGALVVYLLSLFVKTIIVIENPGDDKSQFQHKKIWICGHPSISLSNGEKYPTTGIDMKRGFTYIFNFSDDDMVVYPIVYTDKEESIDESDIPEYIVIESGTYSKVEYIPDYWFSDSPNQISVSSSTIESFGKLITNSATTAIKWGISSYGHNPGSLMENVDRVLSDSTSSFADLEAVMIPFSESVLDYSEQESGEHRIYAQLLARLEYDASLAWLEFHRDDVSLEDFSELVEPLLHAMGQWFYTESDSVSVLWTDVLFSTNLDTEEPSYGSFRLVVNLPSNNTDSKLCIYYPESAAGSPSLIFRKYLSTTTREEDINSQKTIPLNDWYQQNELGEGKPMCAQADNRIVNMMLENDVMYLLFESRSLEGEDNGNITYTNIPLKWFKKLYGFVLTDSLP